jgi:hypothetical protein
MLFVLIVIIMVLIMLVPYLEDYRRMIPLEGLKNKKPANPFKKLGKTIQKKVINPVQKKVKNVFKPKPKPKPKMKIPVPVEFASYADNVTPLNENNVEKDMAEYQKALNGEKSDKMVSKNPLGSLYFQPTGTKCNAPNGKVVDKYIVVDSRADTDLFNSADADFNKSVAPFNILDYSSTLSNKCKPLTITPIDVYGRQLAKQTRYV